MQTLVLAPITLRAMTTDEAICAEFAARIEQFGGINAYCRAFNEDKRNTAPYMKSRVPTFSTLMRHLNHLNVPLGEFFNAVQTRIDQQQ